MRTQQIARRNFEKFHISATSRNFPVWDVDLHIEVLSSSSTEAFSRWLILYWTDTSLEETLSVGSMYLLRFFLCNCCVSVDVYS